MPPKTRSILREPFWDSCSWLSNNYENNNGLPSFFLEGGYTYELRQNAEEDYIYTVNEACKSRDAKYSKWALNIKHNEYCTLNLATTREYWKKAIEEELKERKRDNLNDILLRKSEKLPVAKRQKRTPSIVNDLMYFDGLRDGVGAIILAKANETIITDHKNNYFKTLAMNKIIDISDNSNDSHLDLFNSQQQQQIIDSLSMKRLERTTCKTDKFDDIIEKFSTIEDDGEFLAKVIKEINETSNVNSCIKNIYLQILNSMIDYKYLYDKDEDNSEQDYIVKLYSPIIENCFHGCDIRLRWGDTIPAVCSKVGYQCRIDMRVTVSKKACVDLSVVEYAKDLSIDKYYKDKVKTVLASAIYFRNFQKNSSNVKFIPSMLIARLEGELLIYYKTDRNWFVVEKIDDVDAPQNIDDIRKGSIKSFVESLKYFKDHCLGLKNQLIEEKKMKSVAKLKKKEPQEVQRPFWFSDFLGENSSDDDSSG